MVLAASGPLLQLPTAQTGWWNIPNPSQQKDVTRQNGHPVQIMTLIIMQKNGSHVKRNKGIETNILGMLFVLLLTPLIGVQ